MGEARTKRKRQKLLEKWTEKSLPPLTPTALSANSAPPPRNNSVLETHRARAGEGGRDEVN